MSGKCQGHFYFWKCQGNVREMSGNFLFLEMSGKSVREISGMSGIFLFGNADIYKNPKQRDSIFFPTDF